MQAFVYGVSVTLLAAVLVATGIGHLLHLRRFHVLIRSHNVLPAALSGVAAALVTTLELCGAAVFVAMLLEGAAPRRVVVLATTAVAGVAFLVYLRRLLRNSRATASCGCSPLDGPLTPASLVPAASLVIASILGLASVAMEGVARSKPEPAVLLLAVVWGVTLALLVLLLPAAAVPRAALESGS
jgi:hypothetical protein